MRKRSTLTERLAKHSAIDPESGCRLWTGARGNRYGSIRLNGKIHLAHRVSYELAFGPIPEGLYVCHRCDVPTCIEPSHLFLGTQLDNMRDCVAKGRHSKSDLTLAERLNERSVPGANGCMLWRGRITPNGYGHIKINGVMRGVHRVAWELHRGPIPNGLVVCHRCDVRNCTNPDHLFLGTHMEKMANMYAKGRGPAGDRNGSRLHPENFQGERNGRARLSDDDVRDIRERYALGAKQPALAVEYGVTQAMISKIVLRQAWRHIL